MNKIIKNQRIYLLINAILAAVVLTSIVIAFFSFKAVIIDGEMSKIKVIARRHSNQINTWLDDRRVLSKNLLQIPSIKKDVESLLKNDKFSKSTKQELEFVFEVLKQRLGFSEVGLLNLNLEYLASTAASEEMYRCETELSFNISALKSPSFSKIHFRNNSKVIEVDLFIPILDGIGNDKKVIGVFVGTLNSTEIIQTQLSQYFNVENTSGEFIFAFKSDKNENELSVINKLKFADNHPLEFSIKPTGDPNSFYNFITGNSESSIGIDYRNKTVIAAKEYIPNINWYLIAKIDESEVLSVLIQRTILLSSIIAFFFISIGLIVAAISKKRQAAFFKEKFKLVKEIKAVENELVENEKRLREAQKVAKIASWSRDLITGDFNISDEFYQLVGYSKDEVGKSFESLTKIMYLDDANELLKKSQLSRKQGGISFNADVRYRTKTGESKFGHFKVNYGKNADGEINSITGTFQDITERKTRENKLKNYQLNLEKAQTIGHMGFVNWDLVTDNFDITDEVFRIFGFDKAYTRGIEKIKKIIYPDDVRSTSHSRDNTQIEDKKINIDRRVILPNDKIVWVNVQAEILYDETGEPLEFVGTIIDITERKKNSQNLKKYSQELKEANQTKDKFYSIIAHDLKSPFQGLLGYSKLLSDEYPNLSEDEKVTFIKHISEISKAAYSLLEDLLAWAGLQTGKMELNLESFNLYDQLKPVVSLLKNTALNKKIKLSSLIDDQISVIADKNMLSTVVRNLISNAIKFTNIGGEIIFSTEVRNDLVELSVKDNGIGISEEKLRKLFVADKSKSTKGTADETGTGLGLLLCKEMIEKQNGSIRVESETNKGSNFIFTVPVNIK